MSNGDRRSVATDALETLGMIIDPSQKRDAIHLAVEPVTAAHDLVPGQDIGILSSGLASADALPLLGIVDPFLKETVEQGQMFWLVVYPRKISSLRHVWTHPDIADPFPDLGGSEDLEESRYWVKDFAARIEMSPDDLMAAAEKWVTTNSYTMDNTEGYKNVNYHEFEEFWVHYEKLSRKKVPENDREVPFSCSC